MDYKRNSRASSRSASNAQRFLEITDHRDLAAFLGTTYHELSRLIYRLPEKYRYREFEIPKTSGGSRNIKAPCKDLKALQRRIKEVLYEIYPGRQPVHGFALRRSIVTNAQQHVGKRFVFNLDLEDYFGSIHFGRIKNLFASDVFGFNTNVATILAQICCFRNALPQGAPTSPILANMISFRLDNELQRLAIKTRSTYTRYADDITFSVTRPKHKLPPELILIDSGEVTAGHELLGIIEGNGFRINASKIRLAGITQRMEVTGLTVNEIPNVRRQYIRQISSMLYAWEKHGYDLAATEHNSKYRADTRATDLPKSFAHVIRGKLAFLKSVKGAKDPIFNKLAYRFNSLAHPDLFQFKVYRPSNPEEHAMRSLWRIDVCYDGSDGDARVSSGTAFNAAGFGIITAAHVVTDNDQKIFKEISAYKADMPATEHRLTVRFIDLKRDLAICELYPGRDIDDDNTELQMANISVMHRSEVTLLGFPSGTVAPPYVGDAKVASIWEKDGIHMFEIDHSIRKGQSGGPLVNNNGELVGVALRGVENGFGHNLAVFASELASVHDSNKAVPPLGKS